ncbi:MAG TPA: ChaN family lipoprotein [Longimicrobiales bacterium]
MTVRPYPRRCRTACAALVAAFGCAPVASSPESAGPPAAAAARAPHRIYDAGGSRFIDVETLVADLAAVDVLFVGEQHDDPGTHRLQRALLETLAARGRRVVVGLEMFERDVQPRLDRYLAGRITEAEFLAGARPWPNYRTDYRPLVEFARAKGWPVIATNVPRRIAAAVARAGLDTLAALSPAERGLVAGEIRCPRDAYYERFERAMGRHPMGPDAAATERKVLVERLYAAQCVKDETMAESIAAGLDREAPGTLFVHFNGAFHSDDGLGIVPRLERRRPGARIRVISAIPVADLERVEAARQRSRADYLLFTLALPAGHPDR